MHGSPTPVAIGLGSNLGDRLAHLRLGVERMSGALEEPRCSPVFASRPQGVAPDQPDYLNAVLVGDTRLGPEDLLERARGAEAGAGRERPYPGAPRTLDVDILLYGEEVVDHHELRIPHPHWKRRAFVLEPLSRVAPEWRDPESGSSVLDLWRERSAGLPPVQEVAPSSVLLEPPEPS